ncbi:hypothetical protein ACTFIZ_003474 [Dictyostelium cf. discoideum]
MLSFTTKNHQFLKNQFIQTGVYYNLLINIDTFENEEFSTCCNKNGVERNKQKLLATTLRQYDGTNKVCEGIGRQILTLGSRLSPFEVYKRINEITVADVQRIASTLLRDVSPAVTAIGPTTKYPDYNFFQKLDSLVSKIAAELT